MIIKITFNKQYSNNNLYFNNNKHTLILQRKIQNLENYSYSKDYFHFFII